MEQTQSVTGTTERTKPENKAFYPGLDGIRAIAFLMVFFYHYDNMAWGFAGVDIFFVLSGFLITGILFDVRDRPDHARVFYIRRSLRIFPLYYGILLLALLTSPLLHWQWNWRWIVWPLYVGNIAPYMHMFYKPGPQLYLLKGFDLVARVPSWYTPFHFGHFWTLCVEEQFYLVWPWFVWKIRSRTTLMWICALSLPICLALRIAGLQWLPPWMIGQDVIFHATPFRIDDLLLGGLIALLLRGPSRSTLLRGARVVTPIAFAATALTMWLAATYKVWERPYQYPSQFAVLTYDLTIIGLLSALLILVVIQPDTWLARALSIAPLRWLGRISYGAYVIHVIPLRFFSGIAEHLTHNHQEAATAVVGLVGTFLFAWLSFRFFETPFLNLKDRLTAKH